MRKAILGRVSVKTWLHDTSNPGCIKLTSSIFLRRWLILVNLERGVFGRTEEEAAVTDRSVEPRCFVKVAIAGEYRRIWGEGRAGSVFHLAAMKRTYRTKKCGNALVRPRIDCSHVSLR
jgi:hypothetical protein